MTFDFEVQRKAAAANIRMLKVVTPYIFPEWQQVQQATDALRIAHQNLERAQSAWDRLGQHNVGS